MINYIEVGKKLLNVLLIGKTKIIKMKAYRIFFIVFTAVLFSSCGSFDEVTISKIDEATFEYIENGTVKMSLGFVVDNPNSKFTLKNASLNLLLGNKNLGTLTIKDPAKITSGINQKVAIVAYLKPSGNVWQTIKTLAKLTKDTNSFVVDGNLTLSRRFITKTVDINKMPVKNFSKIISYNLEYPFMMALGD